MFVELCVRLECDPQDLRRVDEFGRHAAKSHGLNGQWYGARALYYHGRGLVCVEDGSMAEAPLFGMAGYVSEALVELSARSACDEHCPVVYPADRQAAVADCVVACCLYQPSAVRKPKELGDR